MALSLPSRSSACEQLAEQKCTDNSATEDGRAPEAFQDLMALLPEILINSRLTPGDAKLAMFRTCKFFRNLLLDNHVGMSVYLHLGVNHSDRRLTGSQLVRLVLKGMRCLELALQHTGREFVKLYISGNDLDHLYPELDIALMRELVQIFKIAELQRVSISGFGVSELVPLSMLALLPKLTHLHLEGLEVRPDNSNAKANIIAELPDLSSCNVRHLDIIGCRIFRKAHARWSRLTTSHVLPHVTSLTVSALDHSCNRFINPASIQYLHITGHRGYPGLFYAHIPNSNLLTAAVLTPYMELTHITIAIELPHDVLPALLGMQKLQEAKLNITNLALHENYINHRWPLNCLTLRCDVIDTTTLQTLQCLPLNSIKRVEISHFRAVQLPDSSAAEFQKLASGLRWVRQTHEVEVSVGTAASAVVVRYLDHIDIRITDECTLEHQFLAALAEAAQAHRLSVNMLSGVPTAQQLAMLPLICKRHNQYVLGMKPVILMDPLPRIHNLTALTIVGEVLDIVLHTGPKKDSGARQALLNRLASWDDDSTLRCSVDKLQKACQQCFERHEAWDDVVAVLRTEFGVDV